MKTIDEILTMLNEMPYDKRDNFAYFCAGMLYGLSVLDADEDALVTLADGEEAEK